jgi:hypothetical protein
MCQSGLGKGILVPTGKHAPALGVDYEISHYIAETRMSDGVVIKHKRAAVQFLTENNGQPIPLGDFDLVIGNEIVRLKHIVDDPEWLVLSSDA